MSVCARICVCIRIHIHIHICTHAKSYIHTYLHKYVHTYLRTYVRTYARTYVHTYIRTHIHTHMHACIHTCIQHTYIYRNVYTCVHRQLNLHGSHIPPSIWGLGAQRFCRSPARQSPAFPRHLVLIRDQLAPVISSHFAGRADPTFAGSPIPLHGGICLKGC